MRALLAKSRATAEESERERKSLSGKVAQQHRDMREQGEALAPAEGNLATAQINAERAIRAAQRAERCGRCTRQGTACCPAVFECMRKLGRGLVPLPDDIANNNIRNHLQTAMT